MPCCNILWQCLAITPHAVQKSDIGVLALHLSHIPVLEELPKHFTSKYSNTLCTHNRMYSAERRGSYNAFNVYRRELAPGTVSLTGDRAQGDDSKHWAEYTELCCFVDVLLTNNKIIFNSVFFRTIYVFYFI